jgi:hypothetical protein
MLSLLLLLSLLFLYQVDDVDLQRVLFLVALGKMLYKIEVDRLVDVHSLVYLTQLSMNCILGN